MGREEADGKEEKGRKLVAGLGELALAMGFWEAVALKSPGGLGPALSRVPVCRHASL